MHETLKKFGAPETQLADFEHWSILLRPKQATLGAMVLCAKSDVKAFSALPPAAFAELESCTKAIESALHATFKPDKFNYLMLMMVDPQVHFHVLPRYSQARTFEGVSFDDPGWPAVPNLGHATEISDDAFDILKAKLKEAF